MDPRQRQDGHWSDYPPAGHHLQHPQHPQHPQHSQYPHHSHPQDQNGAQVPQPPPGSWAHPHQPHMVHVSYPQAGSPPQQTGVYLTPIHYNVASYPPPEFYKSVPARQRSTIACLSCRKRKIRCEQREDGKCENCLRINQTCEFVPVSSQKVAHGSFYKTPPSASVVPVQSPTGPPEGYSPVHHGYPPQAGPSHYGGHPNMPPGMAPGQYPQPHNRHPSQYSNLPPGHSSPHDPHAGGHNTHLPPSSSLYPPGHHPGQVPQHHHSHTLPSPHDGSSMRPLHEISINTQHPHPQGMDGHSKSPRPLSGSGQPRSGRDVLSIRSLVD